MTRPFVLALLSASLLPADFVVRDPKACPDVDAARPIEFSESPLRLSLPGDAACQGQNERGGTVRSIWRYPHQFQRVAAAKVWKVIVEKGDGDRNTFVLPANSVVGVFFHQLAADGTWKPYRGTSRNPIALTQPSIVFTLERQIQKGEGSGKEQFLIWDVLTGDAPAESDGAVKSSSGSELRAESIWIWQGLNPIPKKLNLATGKAKITFQSE